MSASDDPSRSAAEDLIRATDALPAAERTAYLDAACEGRPELRREVEEIQEARGFGALLELASDGMPATSNVTEIRGLHQEAEGERIGNYKLLQQIGEGGFGTVWMAEQVEPVRRRVALKIIKLGMDIKELIARFEQERQALALMDHPNIAKVFDAGATPGGRPFFVMELVRGIPITSFCDQNNLPTAERLSLFIAVCHAVQHAHQKGVIHRDIKPSNILVALHEGVPAPKIIDFGVAKATQQRLTELTLYTQVEQMIGTPLYMSPEQAQMGGMDVDTRSDIYSLGVLLYELLTGRTPFDPAELKKYGRDEVRRAIREQQPVRPSAALLGMAAEAKTCVAQQRQSEVVKLIGLLRGDLDWIVMKAMEKDRTRRYETANGLAEDIQRHLNNQPVLAKPPSFGYRLHRFVRRNRLAVGAAAAVGAAIVFGLAASLWQAVRAERESRRANATLDALRATAPAFAAQAAALTAQERFDEALEKLNYAAQLQPRSAAHWLEIGDLLECQLRFPAAAAAYRTAAECGGDEARARRNAELCDRLDKARTLSNGQLSRAQLAELYALMTSERRAPALLMPVARLLQQESGIALDYWCQRLRTLPLASDRLIEKRLSTRPDGLLKLDLSDTEITDLQPLAGMPLAELDLSRCRAVRRLDPLQGLPLRTLNLDSTEVSELAPLYGMRLESLSLANTQVTDVRALAGMPLKFFDGSNLATVDYAALAGSPLETLILDGARVRNADFVKNLPLRKLSLAGAGEVRQLQAITRLSALETLILPHNFHEFSADDLAAIQTLTGRQTLLRLCAARAGDVRLGSVGPRENFAQEWAADLRWLHLLRQKCAEAPVLRLPDRTWEVDLRDQKLSDLSCLTGAPLSKLVLFNVPVSDLRPLSKMPLRVLDLRRTEVGDLSTLRGMPLHELYLWRVKAGDFSILTELPDLELLDVSETEFADLGIIASRKLRELRIGGSRVTDLTPLAGWPIERLHADAIEVVTVEPLLRCPKLKWLIPPQKARDLTRLKALQPLERIAFHWREGSEPVLTVTQFWEVYQP